MALTGTLARTFNAFDRNNAAIAAIASGGGPLAKLADHFGNIGRLKGMARVVHARVVRRLTPLVRQALAESYARSGLGSFSAQDGSHYQPTGKLHSAVVNASVEVSYAGISIGLAPGQSADVYKRAAALQFGWVAGSKTKGEKHRAREKRTLAYAHDKTGQTNFGGSHYIPPHQFFDIDHRADEIEALYQQAYQEEVDQIIEGK